MSNVNTQINIPLAIIFTILTCGLYSIYWQYMLVEELNQKSGSEKFSPGTVILLTIITCGIYMIYWFYNVGKTLEYIPQKGNFKPEDKSTIFLLLSIFGLSIVGFAILQNDLNSMNSV